MHAITYSRFGPAADVLSLSELPTPDPGPGEVLVEVSHSGVNPSDVKARAGARPGVTKPPFDLIIPHSDGAGRIVAVGDGVDSARKGQPVWLWNGQWQRPFGTAASHITMPAAQAVPLPEAVSPEVGATLGIPGLTAAHAVFGGGDITGQTVLIQGGAGTVGYLAVQLARWGGAQVSATARGAGLERCTQAGAHHVVDFGANDVADRIHLPEDPERGVFLQQSNYLEKELLTVDDLDPSDRPLNQNWSWDRILRSCFIKQADVLQGLWVFEDRYDLATIERNFDFYEPRTVHESSLSPSVHAVLAVRLGRREKAREMMLRTARLDLDNVNNDTDDGCHTTSMAGTWIATVLGFGGMRVIDGALHLDPTLAPGWTELRFQIRFRGAWLSVSATASAVAIGAAGYGAGVTGVGQAGLVVAVVLSMGLVAWWGISQSVTVAAIITVLEILGLVCVITWGFGVAERGGVPPADLLPTADMAVWSGIAAASLLAFFAFIGFEDMVNVAEEVKDPTHAMPRAIFLTLIVATVLYVATCIAVLVSVPIAQLSGAAAPLMLVFANAPEIVRTSFAVVAIAATVSPIPALAEAVIDPPTAGAREARSPSRRVVRCMT